MEPLFWWLKQCVVLIQTPPQKHHHTNTTTFDVFTCSAIALCLLDVIRIFSFLLWKCLLNVIRIGYYTYSLHPDRNVTGRKVDKKQYMLPCACFVHNDWKLSASCANLRNWTKRHRCQKIQYYKVHFQYYKLLRSTTKSSPILQSTTKYYSVLQKTTPILQSTTQVLLRTTKYSTFSNYCTCHEKWHLTFTKYCAYHEKWHLTFTKYCA